MKTQFSRRLPVWLLAAVIFAGLAGAVAWAPVQMNSAAYALTDSVDSPVGTTRIVDIARSTNPAVVNVSTKAKIQPTRQHPGMRPGPFDRFYGPGPQMPSPGPQAGGSGSGFIIDPNGMVLTNHHVVDGADSITVTVDHNGKETDYQAKLIGSDPKTDIALVQIVRDVKENSPLPYLKLGNSDSLDVGEWVVAIGNPFGLSHTVTTGIISAKGRSMGGPYDDYLQTDASINPGNSGGPLINMKGEVIGMNTAIISQSGGNVGIGFAIPSNMVMTIVNQLKDGGKVTRGWLGVMIQRLTPDLVTSFHLSSPEGALVNDVAPKGPAEKGGVQRGDVIVKFENRKISSIDELPRLVASIPPGKAVQMEVIRDGKPVTLQVTIEELTESDRRA
jgi:serine protease Do